jgi:transcriptional regulator with XRE-family HTH domain
MSEQQTLPLPRKREEASKISIYSCNSLVESVRLMIISSGYDLDQVGYALGYSPSHWSEILNGKKNLPWAKLDEAMNFCESDIPLLWWADHRGFDEPRPKQSKAEQRIDELEQQLAAVTLLLKGVLK